MLRSEESMRKASVSRADLVDAITRLTEVFSDGQVDALQPPGPAAIYTSTVTLWMLVMQRLASGSTLNAIVKDFIANRPHFCPDNRRIEEGTLSESSGAYAGARKRLELETVQYLFHRVTDSFGKETSRFGCRPRQTFLLDGTTISLAPTEELARHFPPASNQYGGSVWPIMLLFVAHDLETGCAMFPEVGRMFGGKGDSEALMAEKLVKRLPRGSLAMADAGLGIFRVAWACVDAKQDFLLRLTKQRFDAFTKKATLVENRWKSKVWELNWQPTSKDRRGCSWITRDASLRVKIHQIEISDKGEQLYLVTNLTSDSLTLSDQYRHRYEVETDIKEIKVALDTENIRARSKEMVLKELYTSLTAYNLLTQFRRQAAELTKLPPRRLSFQEVWNTYKSFMKIDLAVRSPEQCIERYQQALEIASRAKIPSRPGRNFKRAAHPRRPKSTKEQRAATKQKAAKKRTTEVNTDDDDKPPNTPK